MGAVRLLGRLFLAFLAYLGGLGGLARQVAESLLRGRPRWAALFRQIIEIGHRSQPVVIVTGAFTGAVLAAQSLFQLSALSMETTAAAVVSVAMLRELGPVITGLMLAGRVGASMAAEIGTMQVTEQVDALRSMDVHPVDYLVTPRILAMLVSMPLLIAESAAFGIVASVCIGLSFNVSKAYWLDQMNRYTDLTDLTFAMTKGLTFGLLIVIISCDQGLRATRGAVGVGQGTTRAMVFSSLAILVFNFFLTMLLNLVFPAGFGSH